MHFPSLSSLNSAVMSRLPSLPSQGSPLKVRLGDVLASAPRAITTSLKERSITFLGSTLGKSAATLALLVLVALVVRTVWHSFRGETPLRQPAPSLPPLALRNLSDEDRTRIHTAIGELNGANKEEAAQKIEAFLNAEEDEQICTAFRQSVPAAILYEVIAILDTKVCWGFQEDPIVAHAFLNSGLLSFSISVDDIIPWPEGKSFSEVTRFAPAEEHAFRRKYSKQELSEEEKALMADESMTILGGELSPGLRTAMEKLFLKGENETEEQSKRVIDDFRFTLAFLPPEKALLLELAATRVFLILNGSEHASPLRCHLAHLRPPYSPKQRIDFLKHPDLSRYRAFEYCNFGGKLYKLAEEAWEELSIPEKEAHFTSTLVNTQKYNPLPSLFKVKMNRRGIHSEEASFFEKLFTLRYLLEMSREGKSEEEWRNFWKQKAQKIETVDNFSNTLHLLTLPHTYHLKLANYILPLAIEQGCEASSLSPGLRHFCDFFAQSLLHSKIQSYSLDLALHKLLYVSYHQASELILRPQAEALLRGMFEAFGEEKIPNDFFFSVVAALTKKPRNARFLDDGAEGRRVFEELVSSLRAMGKEENAQSLERVEEILSAPPVRRVRP